MNRLGLWLTATLDSLRPRAVGAEHSGQARRLALMFRYICNKLASLVGNSSILTVWSPRTTLLTHA